MTPPIESDKDKQEEENVRKWEERALSVDALATKTLAKMGEEELDEKRREKENEERQQGMLRDLHNEMLNVFQSEPYKSWQEAKKLKNDKAMTRTAEDLEQWLSQREDKLKQITIDDSRIQKAQDAIRRIHNEIQPTLYPKEE